MGLHMTGRGGVRLEAAVNWEAFDWCGIQVPVLPVYVFMLETQSAIMMPQKEQKELVQMIDL